jgi:hypothetical protein
MNPKIYAYVRGTVSNEFGSPVANAQVSACGATAATASDGSFDLGEVNAACTSLSVTCSGYAPYVEPLAQIAGLETLVNAVLVFDRL